MSNHLAEFIDCKLKALNNKARDILVLGITFKENVSDLRNTKVINLVKSLKDIGYNILVHDPLADYERLSLSCLDINLIDKDLTLCVKFDCVVLAVEHDYYKKIGGDFIMGNMLNDDGIIIDFKRALNIKNCEKYYTL